MFGKGMFNWLYVLEESGASAIYDKMAERAIFESYYLNKFEDKDFLRVFDNYDKYYQPHLDFLNNISKQDLSKFEVNEFLDIFYKYKKSLIDYFVPMWSIVVWEQIIELVLYKTLRKYFSAQEIEKKALIVLSITSENYLTKEEYDLFLISKMPREEQSKKLRIHADKYGYIPMYDYDYSPYEILYFQKRLKEIDTRKVLEKQKQITENRKNLEAFLNLEKIGELDSAKLRTINLLFNHKDQRSHYRSMDSFLGRKIYKEIARRLNVSVSEILLMTDEEIIDALNGKIKPINTQSRAKKNAFVYLNGKIEIYTDSEMDSYLNENTKINLKNEVRGLAVSSGIAKGQVRIIKTINELSSIQDGDILVTSMTRPDYVATMKKCSAIVTDEGGMLCHAAIVSRELNIPCIVGTRNSTSLLKDGDLIEVNANEGVVKILEKSEEKGKDLVETYIELNKGKKLYPALKSYSAFMLGAGLNLKKYSEKWYQGHVTSDVLILMKEGFSQVWFPEDWFKLASQIGLQEYIKDNKKFQKRVDYFNDKVEEMNTLYSKYTYTKIKELKEEELIKIAEEIRDLTWDTNAPTACVNDVDKNLSWETLQANGFDLSKKEFDKVWEKASEPAFESIDKVQLKEFLTLTINKNGLDKIIEECQYFLTNYHSAKNLSVVESSLKEQYAEFLNNPEKSSKKIKAQSLEIKEIQENHEKWLNSISKNERLLAEYLYTVMLWRDRRKSFLNRGITILYRIAEEMFERAGVQKDLIPYYTVDELILGLEHLKNIKNDLDERKNGFELLVKYSGEIERLNTDIGDATKKVNSFFMGSDNEGTDKNTIQGQIGSKGIIKGKVRIVFDVNSDHGFQKNEILVTGMTRPEFVPLMKKASAIVTDEGGITCHAAIVSRELGIPCVIGTKIATQVLHDGDLIEVNANEGVVNILEKHKGLVDKFLTSTGKDKLALFEGRFLPLLMVIEWFNYYGSNEETKNIYPCLYHRDSKIDKLSISLTKYQNCSSETFQAYLDNKIKIKELENKYEIVKKLIERSYADYYSKKPSNEKDLLRILNETYKDLCTLVKLTLFLDVLDKDIIVSVLERNKININVNKIFDISQISKFPSFEIKNNEVIIDTLQNKKDIEALQHVYTSYTFVPTKEDIEKIVKEINFKDLITHVKKQKDDLKESSKKAEYLAKELSGIERKVLDFIDWSIFLRDDRKIAINKVDVLFFNIARKLFTMWRVDKHLATLAFVPEILKGKDYILSQIEKIQRRDKEITLLYHGNGSYEESIDPLKENIQLLDQKILEQNLKDKSGSRHTLIGECASSGRAKGKVKVILSVKEFHKFSEGDVLVAPMTRPEYVPLMRKAVAIITDEGGITSHAAIVSRELRKPCVIGTRIATKKLKDGDLVEVNATHGSISILREEEKTNSSLNTLLTNRDWIYLVNRPYTLFGASLYQAWFDPPQILELFGVSIPDNVYVEEHQNVVRRYVIKEQQDKFTSKIREIITKDREKAKAILLKGIKLSGEAKRYLEKSPFTEVKSAVDFLVELTLHATVFSYFSYPIVKEVNDIELIRLAEKLRATSYYPQIVEKIINPLAKKEVGGDFNFMTLSEILNKDQSKAKPRKEESQSKRFVYAKVDGTEYVEYINDVMGLIGKLENIKIGNSIKGQTAYPGKVSGRVRLVLTSNPNIEFKEGDILVAVTTNPALMPLIRKSSAIVTDEGGIACHAAIISRELKIPCVVGTKFASHTFKDGDLVEVDANNGFIRILHEKHQKDTEWSIIAKDFNSFYVRNQIWTKGINQSGKIVPALKPFTKTLAIRGNKGKIDYLANPKLWKEMHEIFSAELNKNISLLGKIIEETNKFGDESINLARKLSKEPASKKKDVQLLKELNGLIERQEKLYSFGVLLPLLDLGDQVYVETKLKEALDKTLSPTESQKAFMVLTQPNEDSFAREEEKELLNLAIEAKKDKLLLSIFSGNVNQTVSELEKKAKSFYNKLLIHTERYKWVYYAYAGPAATAQYYVNSLIELVKSNPDEKLKEIEHNKLKLIEDKKEIVKKYAKDDFTKGLFNLAGTFVWAKPRRKDYQSGLYYYMLEYYLAEIAKRINATREQIISLPFEDIEEALLKKNKINAEKAKQIFDEHVILPTGEGLKTFYGNKLSDVNSKIESHKYLTNSSDELKGMAAHGGKVTGRVVIVNTPQEMGKVKEGDILVSIATTPSIIPAMRKAAAFVTDEGGLTCHAAIVAREMKKPCIVGTKVATKVLKDGMMIEVDANNGVVRILSKSSDLNGEKLVDANKELIVMRDRLSMLSPAYWNQVVKTSNQTKEIYGDALGTAYLPYSNGRVGLVIIKEEWDRVGADISDKVLNTKGYFENIIKKTEEAKRHIQSFLKDISTERLENLSFEELIKRSDSIMKLFFEYDAASVFSWFVAGDQIKQKIGSILKLSKEDLDIISLPNEKTFASQMEQELLESALNNSEDTHKQAKRLEKSFYWILFGYDGPTVCDESYFIEQIKLHRKEISKTEKRLNEIKKAGKEISDKKEVIIKREKFSESEKQLIEILHLITIWTDERKMLEFQLFYYYNKVLTLIGKMFGASLKQMKYLFTYELKDLKENSKQLLAESDRRVNKEFIVVSRKDVLKIASDEENAIFKRIIDNQLKNAEIKGSVACAGPQKIYRATVKVLMSSAECLKVKEGEIMVATMTTPDYVPAMKNALGFITDEGGVTCHAAIIAREMNKPCIIGTKFATQILKDGMMVEVDANRGIVTILNKTEAKEDPLLIEGVKWFLTITRNMSFWHQSLSNEGHHYNSRDFGVDANLDIIIITKDGTKTSCFMHNQNYIEYTKAVMNAVNSEEKINILKDKYKDYAKELLSSLDKCKKSLTIDTLDKFISDYKRFTAGLMLTVTIGRTGGDLLNEKLKDLGYSDSEIPTMISSITYPREHTPLFDSQLELLKIGIKIQDKKLKEKEIDEHLNGWLSRHGYIPVNFCEEGWTLTDARAQLDSLLLKDCKKILKDSEIDHEGRIKKARELLNKINNKEVRILSHAIAEGTYLNEFRKNIFCKVSLLYRDIFAKIAQMAGSNNWKDCWYLTTGEIMSIVKGEEINISKLIASRNLIGHIIKEGVSKILDQKITKELGKYVDSIYGSTKTEEKPALEVRGFSANNGKVKGIARIVLNSKEFGKVNSGDILVTTMTSVDFVPIMEKAAAFVTNEGGITSHASIVAREMNKPCIIGTKNATQIIKDGDLVEVDADVGIVRIIKK